MAGGWHIALQHCKFTRRCRSTANDVATPVPWEAINSKSCQEAPSKPPLAPIIVRAGPNLTSPSKHCHSALCMTSSARALIWLVHSGHLFDCGTRKAWRTGTGIASWRTDPSLMGLQLTYPVRRTSRKYHRAKTQLHRR